MFLLREQKINPWKKILGSSRDLNPGPSDYQSDALTTKPLWPFKQHCLEASAGELQLILTLRAGLNWNPAWLKFATFKGPVVTCSPPNSPSSHTQGWRWNLEAWCYSHMSRTTCKIQPTPFSKSEYTLFFHRDVAYTMQFILHTICNSIPHDVSRWHNGCAWLWGIGKVYRCVF